MVLPEIYSCGIFDTSERAIYKDKDLSTPTPLRTVREYELELFLEDGGVSFLDSIVHPIKKGDVLVAKPGNKRQSLLHFKTYFLHFGVKDSRLEELINELDSYISVENFEKYHKLFKEICEPNPGFDEYKDVADASRLLILLYTLRKDCAAKNSTQSNTAFSSVMPTVMQFIREHYSEPIEVEDLARACNLSTSYFYRIFLKAADMPPNEFLTKTRLNAAQNLLISTDLPIIEIAGQCGFGSQSYFSYSFKHHFGETPNQFRKNHRYPID